MACKKESSACKKDFAVEKGDWYSYSARADMKASFS
jgi:hypothetical protein